MSCKNIVLIGFMGTGKTAVGRLLAIKLGREFLDTDAEIERRLGKSVARIFAEDGEARFRDEEAALCRLLADRQGLVIATGGGTVLNPENVYNLRRSGILIALSATPEEIYRRVASASLSGTKHPPPNFPTRPENNDQPAVPANTRPLLAGDVRTRIRELLETRAGAYEVADWHIDTTSLPVEVTVEAIIAQLKGRGCLD